MDVFEEVIQELKSKEMSTEIFEDGYVKGQYHSDQDGYLLLTIPYDDGWDAYVNGKQVEITDGANALSVIPVKEGENEIELKYSVPGWKTGIGLSAVGILLFAGICQLERHGKRKRENEKDKRIVGR